MSFERVNDSDYYAPPADGFGVIPLAFYVAGTAAVSAAAATASWLSKDEWGPTEYNNWMRTMYDTIRLWDQLGWQQPAPPNACWAKNAAKRTEWKMFMERFGKFYGANGQQSVYVPDSVEVVAREFMRTLALWGDWLNKTCGIETGGTVEPPPPPKPRDPADWMTLGIMLVGGVLVLNLISGIKDVTRR